MSVAIQTRFLGPTNYRGARIVATVPARIAEERDTCPVPAHRHSDRAHWTLTMPYPHELESGEAHRAVAMALATRLGWIGVWYGGSLADGYVFVHGGEPYAVVADGRPE